jgi:hypothetical protein
MDKDDVLQAVTRHVGKANTRVRDGNVREGVHGSALDAPLAFPGGAWITIIEKAVEGGSDP